MSMQEQTFSRLVKILERIRSFNKERDWEQFHNPKDIAISLSLEASELLEHFQWKSPQEIEKHLTNNKDAVAAELADVFYWVLLMADDLNIDLIEALECKMNENEKKYPVEKARGSHEKYIKYERPD